MNPSTLAAELMAQRRRGVLIDGASALAEGVEVHVVCKPVSRPEEIAFAA